MFFWWFMLINGLLIPGIMILFGWLLWKHGPKDINSFYGYNTLANHTYRNQFEKEFLEERLF
ncbi:hypothetical protein SAMN04487831_10156 [Pseudobutyrivibrio sp. UC1225]|uniref:hypothetical protein n=1 Tax=Pseudobutyrivibrio sp. UC1225 TaxID=1798185 RepID=UPI0003F6ADC4|nr:hypothetical protein [Pseudobutyrivibrio sp. UC1225]SFN40949.1 hypothetical protein SAMN04487831_10156 [Pseudobutyrivibrio sp. UC1225]